jgi:hypothetical protein
VKRILRSGFSVVLIVATILGLINVYGDNSETKLLAERTACGDDNCATAMTRMERNPISQSFTFQTGVKQPNQGARTVEVTCRRSAWLLGDYECAIDEQP